MRIRSADDPRVRRFQRELSAPGLPRRTRERLLRKWMRQGRSCSYCPAPATTVDHVLPLVRGGTNYEGNLTPCCRSCNGSKAGWLLVEWRTGRRLAPMPTALGWVLRAKVKPPTLLELERQAMVPCPVCEAMHDGAIYCSSRCAARARVSVAA